MFRPLGGALKKREQELHSRERGSKSISAILATILVEYSIPREVLSRISITHNEARREVIIDTPSKSVAHQLIMSSLEIKSLIQEAGVRVSSLVIR